MPYLGFEVGEVWSHALNLPESSAAWPTVQHAYRNVIDHCRLMTKFEEWEKNRHRPMWDVFLERLERARSLDLDIVFCLDWHNTWHLRDPNNPNNYHAYTYLPRSKPLRDAVAHLVDLVKPKVLQVSNEPYARTRLGTQEYAERLYDYVRGATDAGFRGKILGQQTYDDRGRVADGWEWHVGFNQDHPDALIVEWDHGAVEGKHRHPRVLHGITSVAGLRGALESNAWAGRRTPKGWRHLVWHDEMSPLGKEVHINSPLGAQMVTEALSFFNHKRVPMTFLTMGGFTEDWGADANEGWGMNTDLVNMHGELSLGARALYDFKRVPYPDGEPDGEPDEEHEGLRHIHKAQNRLDRSERNWPTPKGVRQARRAIASTRNALSTIE